MSNSDFLPLALAMVIAVLLDDLVAVQENIVRHIELGTERRGAARLALAEIRGPLRAGTLAFLPLLVLSGLAGGPSGRGFVSVALGVGVGVLVSMAFALTFLPRLTAWLRWPRERPGAIERWSDRLTDYYHDALASVLDHRKTALAVNLGLLVLSAAVPGAIARIGPAAEGGRKAVQVELHGPDRQTLRGVALRVAEQVREVPGLVDLDITPAGSTKHDVGGDHAILVEAGIAGRPAAEVAGEVLARIDTIPLPPGHQVALGGSAVDYVEALGRFPAAIGLAAVLGFLVLLLRFRSWAEPLSVLLVMPLVAAATMGAGMLLGMSVTLPWILGMTLILGISLRHATVLVSCARRRRYREGSLRVALIGAGRVRLRPVLSTTVLLAAGTVPLLVLGSGGIRDFGRGTLLGVILAVPVTLLLVPALYDILAMGGVRGRLVTWRSAH